MSGRKSSAKSTKFLFIVITTILLIINFSSGLAQGFPQSEESKIDEQPAAQVTPVGPAPAMPTSLPEVNTFENSVKISLQQINVRSFQMIAPSTQTFSINLPNQWVISGDPNLAYLELHYDFFYTNTDTSTSNVVVRSVAPPTVSVYVDTFFAKSFSPVVGKNQVEVIPIPYSALRDQVSYYTTNTHDILINAVDMDTDYCLIGGEIFFRDDSFFNLSFTTRPALISLSDFPRPLVMESFLPETLYVILPDQFNETDLAAASSVINAIGKNTTANVKFSMITTSQVNTNALKNHSAIVIGTPGKNNFIKQLYQGGYLPTALLTDGSFASYGKNGQEKVPTDNGIVQMIPSNLNNVYSFLVVTGANDDAVAMAGKGLANLPKISFSGNTSIIKPISETSGAQVAPAVQSSKTIEIIYKLSELSAVRGFITKNYLLNGRGTRASTIDFFVPIDWEIQKDAKLVLKYEYASTLSLKNSSLSVVINGQPVGNAPLVDHIQGKKEVVIPLDKALFIPGRINTLSFEAFLAQEIECANWDPASYWMNIDGQSLLILPYNLITDTTKMQKFVHPFEHLAYETNILYVLPPSPKPVVLDGLANMIFRIGRMQSQTKAINYKVAYGSDTLDMNAYKDYHVVLIGKPSDNPLIQSINDYLPQPFVPGEDSLMYEGGGAVFRIPQDTQIGVVEVINSPWNPSMGVTVVTGTADEGLVWSTNMIGSMDLPFDWNGDIFFMKENTILGYVSTILGITPINEIVSSVIRQDVDLSLVDKTLSPSLTQTPTVIVEKYEAAQTSGGSTTNLSVSIIAISIMIAIGLVVMIISGIRASRGGRK